MSTLKWIGSVGQLRDDALAIVQSELVPKHDGPTTSFGVNKVQKDGWAVT